MVSPWPQKTWGPFDIPTNALLNLYWRDPMNLLNQHRHTGEDGDGASDIGPLDTVTFDEHTPSLSDTAGISVIYADNGALKLKAGVNAPVALAVVGDTIGFEERQQNSAFALITPGTGSTGAAGTTYGQTRTVTLSVLEGNIVAMMGHCCCRNDTLNNDGHTLSMRLLVDGVQVKEHGPSGQLSPGQRGTRQTGYVTGPLSAGSHTFQMQYKRTGGTGNLEGVSAGVTAIEIGAS